MAIEGGELVVRNAAGKEIGRFPDKSVPAEVKRSPFGCMNCLWDTVECTGGTMYQPKTMADGAPSCKGYNYYD